MHNVNFHNMTHDIHIIYMEIYLDDGLLSINYISL